MTTLRPILICLVVLMLAGCASGAPPYVPAPPQNYTSAAWSPSSDPSVTGYMVEVFQPGATNWQDAFATDGTNAPGILTNYPSGSALCVTATNLVAKSLPSNQITNVFNVAPGAPGALSAK